MYVIYSLSTLALSDIVIRNKERKFCDSMKIQPNRYGSRVVNRLNREYLVKFHNFLGDCKFFIVEIILDCGLEFAPSPFRVSTR
jgi:hypothetical protein